MEKINFSGGEPFIEKLNGGRYGSYVGELVKYSKELGINTSIVSNGSLVSESWFSAYGSYLDYFAVSCDSFNEATNKLIGRGKGLHLKQVSNIRDWCEKYAVLFKLNTVVNVHNCHEDMTKEIETLAPKRWKVFQCLLLDSENSGEGALRQAAKLVVTNEQFENFLKKHESVGDCLVPESNEAMKDSYLILDEKMRFLNCQDGGKRPGPSLLEVGVDEALEFAGFDCRMFEQRGGSYTYNKIAVMKGQSQPKKMRQHMNIEFHPIRP